MTMDTTYEYDKDGNLTKVHSISEFSDTDECSELNAETGIEVSDISGMSPIEVFLTAVAGAIVGNLLCRIICKADG